MQGQRALTGIPDLPDRCGNWSASRVDLVSGQVTAGVMWCKSWHCEYCAPLRQKQLMAQAADGSPNKFITLTSRYRPDEMSPAEAAQQLVHSWRMAVQRGKRDGLFTDIQYIAVFELTKKGWPHLHILARSSFLSQSWLSDRMGQYCDSPVVHVRAVDSKKRAAWYVAKYTAKAPQKIDGCKRYWRTLRYDITGFKREKPVHDHFKGYVNEVPISIVAGFYEKAGYRVAWDSEHSFMAIPGALDCHAKQRQQFRKSIQKPYKEH